MHFWQKFRESNGFTKSNAKELIWRKTFLMGVNFSFFHTVVEVQTWNFSHSEILSCKEGGGRVTLAKMSAFQDLPMYVLGFSFLNTT